MKVAAIYDIHGNLPALEAVLEEVTKLKVDQIVAGGDVVLGPMSRECLSLLSGISIPIQFIKGNCEVSVLNAKRRGPAELLPKNVLEDIHWTADQLLPDQEKQIATWPKTLELDVEGLGKVLFCHGTPRDENENFT
ncbi:MAG: metallophosphoesterase family protein, partial [Cyclobacteriaceae bacterium]